jgi:hypothetical protein
MKFGFKWLIIYTTSNLCDNFQFNATWHSQFVVALIFCRKLAGNDVTVTPSFTYRDWLHWWYNHVAHTIFSSPAWAFLTNMSEICKWPSAIQVKSQQKTISIEEKLDIISWQEEGEQIVDMCHNVRLTYSNVYTVCDNAGRIKESALLGTKCLCSKTSTVLSEWPIPKTMDVILLHFYCIRNKLMCCIEMYVYCTGSYIHYWCSHTLHRMRLSIHKLPGKTL